MPPIEIEAMLARETAWVRKTGDAVLARWRDARDRAGLVDEIQAYNALASRRASGEAVAEEAIVAAVRIFAQTVVAALRHPLDTVETKRCRTVADAIGARYVGLAIDGITLDPIPTSGDRSPIETAWRSRDGTGADEARELELLGRDVLVAECRTGVEAIGNILRAVADDDIPWATIERLRTETLPVAMSSLVRRHGWLAEQLGNPMSISHPLTELLLLLDEAIFLLLAAAVRGGADDSQPSMDAIQHYASYYGIWEAISEPEQLTPPDPREHASTRSNDLHPEA